MDDFTNAELIQELHFLAERDDREAAHGLADEILVIALVRAAGGEVSDTEATDLVSAYRSVSNGTA